MAESWTSLGLIRWTTEYFEKKGIPNPRLDAELLLAHALRCQRIDLYTQHEKKIPEKDLTKFRALVERRAKREPLQYILGEAEFWGLKIKVTPDVLIPRPETELLVEEAVRLLQERGGGSDVTSRSAASQQPSDAKRRESRDNDRAAIERGRLSVTDEPAPLPWVLEIGTGSGCIAIALAKKLPSARVTATDISAEALEIARANAKTHGVTDRLEFILADIAPWRVFKAEGRFFDLIISNPPYIPTGDFETLQPEVRDFEPRNALDGGPDGLKVIRRILDETPLFLKRAGTLLLEIGNDQRKPLEEALKQQSSLTYTFKKDLAGIERLLILKKQ